MVLVSLKLSPVNIHPIRIVACDGTSAHSGLRFLLTPHEHT